MLLPSLHSLQGSFTDCFLAQKVNHNLSLQVAGKMTRCRPSVLTSPWLTLSPALSCGEQGEPGSQGHMGSLTWLDPHRQAGMMALWRQGPQSLAKCHPPRAQNSGHTHQELGDCARSDLQFNLWLRVSIWRARGTPKDQVS